MRFPFKSEAQWYRSDLSTRISTLIMLFCLLFLSGCVERKIDGNVILFDYFWWVIPVQIFVGIILTIGGRLILKMASKGVRIRRLAWAAVIVGPLTVLIGPVVVNIPPLELDASGFRYQTGWGQPKRHELVFESTKVIEISSSQIIGSRIRTIEFVYIDVNGLVQHIDVGDQLKSALTDVISFANKAGVLVRDLR